MYNTVLCLLIVLNALVFYSGITLIKIICKSLSKSTVRNRMRINFDFLPMSGYPKQLD